MRARLIDLNRPVKWKGLLRFDPLPQLLSSHSVSIRYFAKRDLLAERAVSVRELWRLPAAQKIVDSQLRNGAWKYHGGGESIRSHEDYDQIETYRVLRELVEKFGFTRENRTTERTADFLFSRQTEEGDFRGIIGNQYVPYYSAGIMELLIKSGYWRDPRIERGFKWLNSIRQNDGGWALPLRTIGRKLDLKVFTAPTIAPDRSKPFSHLITGMVLRAFAAHPHYRRSEQARIAGRLLKSRFFQADKYPDRKSPSFWTSFSFPFWFTDLLSALDSLSLLGFRSTDAQIKRATEWFVTRQEGNGSWKLPLRIMAREPEPNAWIALAICRVLKRLRN